MYKKNTNVAGLAILEVRPYKVRMPGRWNETRFRYLTRFLDCNCEPRIYSHSWIATCERLGRNAECQQCKKERVVKIERKADPVKFASDIKAIPKRLDEIHMPASTQYTDNWTWGDHWIRS